jgi:hypothetical protein
LLLGALGVAPTLAPVQEFARGKIVDAVNGALSGRMQIDRISGTFWTNVRLDGVRLWDERGNLLIAAPCVEARYDLLALPGNARLEALTIVDPLVIGRIYPDGVFNFSLIAPPSPKKERKRTSLPLDLTLQDITVAGGTLLFVNESFKPDEQPAADLTERLALASRTLEGDASLLIGPTRRDTIASLTAPRALTVAAAPRIIALDAADVAVELRGTKSSQSLTGSIRVALDASADTWSHPVKLELRDATASAPLEPGVFKATVGALLLTPQHPDSQTSGLRDLTAQATLTADTQAASPLETLDIKLDALRIERDLMTTLAAGIPVRAGLLASLHTSQEGAKTGLKASLSLLGAPGAIRLEAGADNLLPALRKHPGAPAPTYHADLVIERLTTEDIWPLPQPVAVEGELHVKGTGLSGWTAAIEANGSLKDTSYGDYKLDSLALSAGLDNGRVTLRTLALRTPYADLDASGAAEIQGPFHLGASLSTNARHQQTHTLPDGRTIAQQAVDVTIAAQGELDAGAPGKLNKVPSATITAVASIGRLDAPGVTVRALRTTNSAADDKPQPITLSLGPAGPDERLVRWDLGVAAAAIDAPGLQATGLDARTQGQLTLTTASLTDPQALLDALRVELVAHTKSLRAGANAVGPAALTLTADASAGAIDYAINADVAALRIPGASVRRVRTTDAQGKQTALIGSVALAPNALRRPSLYSIERLDLSGPVHVEGVRAGSVSLDDVILTPKLHALPLLNPSGTVEATLRGLSVKLPAPAKPDQPPAPPVERAIRIPRAVAKLEFAAGDDHFALSLDADYMRPGATQAAPLRLDTRGAVDLTTRQADIKRLALQLPGSLWQLEPTRLALYADGARVNALELRADPLADGDAPDLSNPPAARGRLGSLRADGALRLRGSSDLTAELVGWDLALLRDMAGRLWDVPLPDVRGKLHQIVVGVRGTARSPDVSALIAADGLFFEQRGPFAVALDARVDPLGVHVQRSGIIGWGLPLVSLSAELPIALGLDRAPTIRWDAPARLKLDVARIALAELQAAIPPLADAKVTGHIGGHIELTGTLGAPRLDAKLAAHQIAAHPLVQGKPITLGRLDACAALCYRPPGTPASGDACTTGCGEAPTQSAQDGITASARVRWEDQPVAAVEASAALPVAVWVRGFFERGALPQPSRDVLSKSFNLFVDVPRLDLAQVRQRINLPQLTQHDAEGILAFNLQGNGTLDDPTLNMQLRVGAIEDVERDDKGRPTVTRTTGGLGWDRYRDIALAADATLSRGVLRLRDMRLNWDAKDIFLGSVQLGSRARRLPTVSALLARKLPDDIDVTFDLELVNTPVSKLSAVYYKLANVRGDMGAHLVGTGSLRKPEIRGRAHLIGTELGRDKRRKATPADLCLDFKIADNALEGSGFVQTWTGQRPAIHALLPTPCERSWNFIKQNAPEQVAKLGELGITDKASLLARIHEDGTRDLIELLADARAYTDLIAVAQGADPLAVPDKARQPIPPRREFSQRITAQIAGVKEGKLNVREDERDRVIQILKQRLLGSIMRPEDDLRIHAFTELGQQIELRELIPEWPLKDIAKDIDGKLLIDLDVQGSYQRLNPAGFLALNDGTITLPSQGRRFDKLTMRIGADDQKISISELSLEEHRARLQMSGDVTHRFLHPTGLELKMMAREFDFGSFGGTPLFVSAQVAVAGEVHQRRGLDAKVDVDQLNVRLPKSDKSLHPTTPSGDIIVIRPGQPRPTNPELAGLGQPITQQKRAMGSLDANIQVTLAKDSWVRTEFGDVNFDGAILAKLDDGVLGLSGQVRTIRGGVEFLGKSFTVAPGLITFNGANPPNPSLQIEAVHILDRALIADIGQPSSGEPRIIVRVTGTAKKPELQLMSDPAMSETDILYILATGKPPSSAGVGQNESALGAALQAASGVFLGLLQQQLSGKVPVDVVRFQGSNDASSAGSIEVGKYITEKLFVSYAHVFSAGETQGANEFKVEYQFLPHWLIEVKYSDTNRGQLNIFWDAY